MKAIKFTLAAAAAMTSVFATPPALAAERDGYVTKLVLPSGEKRFIRDAEANAKIDDLRTQLPSLVSNNVDRVFAPQAFSFRLIDDEATQGYDCILSDHVMNSIYVATEGHAIENFGGICLTNRTATGKHNFSLLCEADTYFFDSNLPVTLDFSTLVENGNRVYCNMEMTAYNTVELFSTNLPLIVSFDEPRTNICVVTIKEYKPQKLQSIDDLFE